jgi:CRP-like cAMP-binding protein
MSLEVLDSVLSRELKRWVFPLIDGLPAEDRLRLLAKLAPLSEAGPESAVLSEISDQARLSEDLWLEACVLYSVGSAKVVEAREVLETAMTSPEPVVRETAIWALWKLDPEGLARRADEATLFAVPRDVFHEILGDRTEVAYGFLRVMARRLRGQLAAKHALIREREIPIAPPPEAEEIPDFETWLPVEQMLLLKSLPLFSRISEPPLLEIAGALKKHRAKAGETIIQKGDVGTSLFIVVAGCVRIHDDLRTLAFLDRGQIFGELSVVDREVRMASATAEVETQIYRLDQDALFEIMAEQPELAAALMKELTRRVREEQDLMSRLSSL